MTSAEGPRPSGSTADAIANLGQDGASARRAPVSKTDARGLPHEWGTSVDPSRPLTVEAAADQAYAVKARQRVEFHEADPIPGEQPKVGSPLKLTGASWRYSFKRSIAEFGRDQCTDLAAGLTYYAVLSVFPALIALVSLLGLVGEADRVTDFFVDTVADLSGNDDSVTGPVELIVGNITSTPGAGLGLAIGILTAMWTASNYVNAFSRAMNRIMETDEGRSFLKLRPVLYVVTAILIMMVALSGVMLVVSGPLAASIGNVVGLGDTAIVVWNWASPVLMILIAASGIALLYTVTPNVRQPGPQWISAGALIAILVMVLSTVAVGIYVMNFASYDATYGSLASVIVFLFWVYVMNVVLLYGAELDAELERSRQLQAGIPAERTILVPPRELKAAKKKHTAYEKLVQQGQALRLSQGATNSPDDYWRDGRHTLS